MTLVIAGVSGRKKGGVRDFFVAGGKLPWILLVPLLMAEYVSSGNTIGSAEMAHQSGVISLWYFIGAPLGLLALVWGLVKFYQHIKKITVGEAFAVLFDKKTRLVCVLILLGAAMLSLGGTFIALGAIIAPMFNIPYEAGVWLSTAFIVGLAITGGLKSLVWMNMLHLSMIIICFGVGTVLCVNAAGGLDHVLVSLPSEHFNLFRPGVSTVLAWLVGGITVKLVSPIAVTAVFAAKDVKSAKIGALSTGAFLLLFATLPMLIGFAAYTVMPDIPSRMALWEIGEYAGVAVSTMLSVGVIAAMISTTPGVLLALGALATRDIFLNIKADASEGSQLIFTRIIVPVIGVVGTFFALTQASIMELALKTFQVRGLVVVPLLVSVLWRRMNATAAFYTTILGAGTGLIWFVAGTPFGIQPLWPGLAVSILTVIVSSLIREPSPFRGAEGLEIH